ncbi:unnamed protein product [Arabidopsis halleri]
MTVTEAKKLLRLVNVEDMKKKLIGMGDKEMVSYTTLNNIEEDIKRMYKKPQIA